MGTPADEPPLVYQKDGQVLGAEAELAELFAARVNRPLQFVILSREQLVGSLLTGEVDILVSGLTLDTARQLRIGATDAFLQSGQMALCRRTDRARFSTTKAIKNGNVTIGVRKGGAAEILLPRLFPRCALAYYVDATAGIKDLVQGHTISLYVDDACVVWGEVSKKDSALAMLPYALSADLYVWGIRHDDIELAQQINKAFDQWRRDGTLRAVLKKWLPIAD